MEIERKWLLRDDWKLMLERTHPDLRPTKEKIVEAIYITSDPYIRVMKRTTLFVNGMTSDVKPDYKITYKGPGVLSRVEIENPVEEKFYNEMVAEIGKLPIIKHCYFYDDIVISDVDPGTPNVFSYAEVEFDTEEAAKEYQFPWPRIIEEDITEMQSYKMNKYWFRTRVLAGTK